MKTALETTMQGYDTVVAVTQNNINANFKYLFKLLRDKKREEKIKELKEKKIEDIEKKIKELNKLRKNQFLRLLHNQRQHHQIEN